MTETIDKIEQYSNHAPARDVPRTLGVVENPRSVV
jgi:hypothetical protein